MHNRSLRTVAGLTLLLLAGCSTIDNIKVDKLWPFNDKPGGGQSHNPANATEFQCSGGKHFFVRYADNGATAWLIYPDREVGLTRAATGSRYSNGVAVLEIGSGESTLTDGSAIAYKGCKAAGK